LRASAFAAADAASELVPPLGRGKKFAKAWNAYRRTSAAWTEAQAVRRFTVGLGGQCPGDNPMLTVTIDLRDASIKASVRGQCRCPGTSRLDMKNYMIELEGIVRVHKRVKELIFKQETVYTYSIVRTGVRVGGSCCDESSASSPPDSSRVAPPEEEAEEEIDCSRVDCRSLNQSAELAFGLHGRLATENQELEEQIQPRLDELDRLDDMHARGEITAEEHSSREGEVRAAIGALEDRQQDIRSLLEILEKDLDRYSRWWKACCEEEVPGSWYQEWVGAVVPEEGADQPRSSPVKCGALSFSLMGGVNLASLELSPEPVGQADHLVRYVAGAGLGLDIGPGLSLEIDCFYVQRGSSHESQEGEYTITSETRIDYFVVSPMIRIAPRCNKSGPYVQGGVELGFLLEAEGSDEVSGAGESFSETFDIKDRLKETDLGVVGTVGLQFGAASGVIVFLEGRYSLGLENIWNGDGALEHGDTADAVDTEWLNRGIYVLAGVRF
jgi:hypothetical protein